MWDWLTELLDNLGNLGDLGDLGLGDVNWGDLGNVGLPGLGDVSLPDLTDVGGAPTGMFLDTVSGNLVTPDELGGNLADLIQGGLNPGDYAQGLPDIMGPVNEDNLGTLIGLGLNPGEYQMGDVLNVPGGPTGTSLSDRLRSEAGNLAGEPSTATPENIGSSPFDPSKLADPSRSIASADDSSGFPWNSLAKGLAGLLGGAGKGLTRGGTGVGGGILGSAQQGALSPVGAGMQGGFGLGSSRAEPVSMPAALGFRGGGGGGESVGPIGSGMGTRAGIEGGGGGADLRAPSLGGISPAAPGAITPRPRVDLPSGADVLGYPGRSASLGVPEIVGDPRPLVPQPFTPIQIDYAPRGTPQAAPTREEINGLMRLLQAGWLPPGMTGQVTAAPVQRG